MKHIRLQKLTSSYATLLPIAHHAFWHIDFGQHICQRREPPSDAKLHISVQDIMGRTLNYSGGNSQRQVMTAIINGHKESRIDERLL